MPSLMDFFTGNNAKAANAKTFSAYKTGADAARTGALGAIGTGRTNQAGAAFIRSFVEEAKRSGLVARLIERHAVQGLSVAPPA